MAVPFPICPWWRANCSSLTFSSCGEVKEGKVHVGRWGGREMCMCEVGGGKEMCKKPPRGTLVPDAFPLSAHGRKEEMSLGTRLYTSTFLPTWAWGRGYIPLPSFPHEAGDEAIYLYLPSHMRLGTRLYTSTSLPTWAWRGWGGGTQSSSPYQSLWHTCWCTGW